MKKAKKEETITIPKKMRLIIGKLKHGLSSSPEQGDAERQEQQEAQQSERDSPALTNPNGNPRKLTPRKVNNGAFSIFVAGNRTQSWKTYPLLKPRGAKLTA